ncbi:MAG: homoserine O-succinyltransferase [Acidimicrobiia bacterium]
MPVIIPDSSTDLIERLNTAGAVVMSESDALTQDIRPARIGLLNLMPAPAMESTENQWLRYISNTVLQVEPVLLKFDNDLRERDGASRREILKHYIKFSDGIKDGLDGLIVTGDNLELRKDPKIHEALPFEEITYGDSLKEVIDWARKNVFLNDIFVLRQSFCSKSYIWFRKKSRR